MSAKSSRSLVIKKAITGALILLALAPVTANLHVQKAEAIPVIDAVNAGLNELGLTEDVLNTIETTLTTGYSYLSSAMDTAMKNKEFTLDGIAWSVAKAAVSSIVQSTTEWVRSGFNGSPAFVTDLNGLLLSTADGVANEYIGGTGLNVLCEPFALNIRAALDFNYRDGRIGDNFARCNIADVSRNLSTFGKSVENAADWTTWMDVAANKTNNPYGALVEAEAGLGVTIENARGEQVNLLSFGSGFLSQKKCTFNENGREHCSVVTPGQTISESLNKSLGLGSDSLVAADEINELVGALIGQLVQTVMSESGLAGYTSPSDDNYIGYSAEPPAIDVTPTARHIDDLNATQGAALAIFNAIEANITRECTDGETTRKKPIADALANIHTHQYDLIAVRAELTELSTRAYSEVTDAEAMSIVDEYNVYTRDSRVYLHTYELTKYQTSVNNLVSDLCFDRERNRD